jgi:hypothetical protein
MIVAGQPTEEMITTYIIGMKSRRSRWRGPGGGDDLDGDDDPFNEHPMCRAACRNAISDLFASIDECLQTMVAMHQGLGVRVRRRLQVRQSQREEVVRDAW